MSAFLVLALTFGLMYALFIRPQSKRVRAHRDLLGTVSPGDSVMLTSGLYGTVVDVDVDDDVVWLEVAEDVELKVARGAIAKKVPHTESLDDDDLDDGDLEDADADDSDDDDVVGDEPSASRRQDPTELG